MAGNSGYVDFTGTNYASTQTLRVYWQETVSDAPGAKSTVSITKVQLASQSYVGDTYYGDFILQINGTDAVTVTGNAQTYLSNFNTFYDVTSGGNQLTGSVSNIAHNADGTKSVNITLKKNTISYAGFYRTGAHFSFTTTSVSKSITLYTIPVGTLSISAGTGSSIAVTRNGTALSAGANLWYGQALVITFGVSTGYTLATHTVNGTTFTSGGTHTVTGNVSVVSTATQSISSISTGNGTFGAAQTITVTRYVASYTHTIVASCAGQSQTIATKSSSLSISWTPDPAIMNHITAAMTASCTLTCTTYNGNTSLGSTSITITLSLPTSGTYSVMPAPSITDSDANGYKTTMGGYVSGKSALAVAITDGLKYSATVATRSTTANGVSSGAASFNAGTLTGNTTISTSVKDSRGKTGTASKSITVLSYASPSITTFAVHRTDSLGNADDMGDYFVVTWGISVTALNNNNTRSLKLKYKRVSLSTWTEQTITLNSYTDSGTTSPIAASGDYSWDVQLILADYFETVTKSTKLSTAAVVESRRPKGKGVAFSKVAETDKALDIGDWTAIGRVMGLGLARAAIPSGADLNDYAEPGVYAATNNAIAGTLSNRPTDYAGTLRVWVANGNSANPGDNWYYVIQEYVSIYTDTWRRLGQSGSGTTPVWGAWSYYAGPLSVMKSNLGIGNLLSENKYAANSSNTSFSVSNDEKGAVIITGSSNNAKTIVVFNVNPTGSVTYKTLVSASGITVSTSTNTLTIANSSGYAAYCLKLSYIYS